MHIHGIANGVTWFCHLSFPSNSTHFTFCFPLSMSLLTLFPSFFFTFPSVCSPTTTVLYSHFNFLKIMLPVIHFPAFSFCYSSVASINKLGECKTQVMWIFLCHSISRCPLTDFLFLGVNKFTMGERVTEHQDMCFNYRFTL